MQRSQNWASAAFGVELTFAIEDADGKTHCIVGRSHSADGLRRGGAKSCEIHRKSRPVGRASISAGVVERKDHRRNGAGTGLGRLRLPAGTARSRLGASLQKRRLQCSGRLRLPAQRSALHLPLGQRSRRSKPSTSTTRATSFTMTFPRPNREVWFSSPIQRSLGRNTG